jgi:hypothetical protein
MKPAITLFALLLPITASAQIRLLPGTAYAQPLPVPRQPGPGGACPVGYAWSGSFCTPLSNNSAPAIPKPPNGTCPYGWASSGPYCVRI